MNISKHEQRVLHMLALGGAIHHERDEHGKIRNITCYTREGHILTNCTLAVFLRLRKRRFIRSSGGRPYRASRLGIEAVRAQLNQRQEPKGKIMEFTTEYKDRTDDIVAMFFATFSDSEGAEEGAIIKQLVADMLTSVGPEDMRVFSAVQDGDIPGSILFSRMRYEQDGRTVFLLSPVAVSTKAQGKGVGQRLISHGLDALRADGVDVVLTYGDINFYSKVGFRPITGADAQAPLPLQYPQGWLGQSLDGPGFAPLVGPSQCVAPLNDKNLW